MTLLARLLVEEKGITETELKELETTIEHEVREAADLAQASEAAQDDYAQRHADVKQHVRDDYY